MIVTDYAEFQRTFERRSELMTERLKTRPASTGYTPPPRHVGSADAPITVSSGSMRRFYGAKWLEGLSDPSSTGTSLDHSALRAQARRKYHESVQARALVDRFADTVIDLGLRLEPAPMASVLGLTTERAEEWSKDVGDRFHLWASSRGSYRTEQMNFYQSQRLAEIQQQRENDYFARLYYNRRRDLLNPLQVGFIDADQIVGDANTVTTGLQMADDGIVTDAAGREIGYKVQWIDQAGVYHSKTIPAVGARSGRRLMLHGFRPEYAGQRRGYSPIAHAIQEFELITDYTLAEVKKAINQSNLTMFVKPSKDQVASNPWEGILRPGTAGPAAAQYGATPTDAPEGSQPLNIEDYLQYTPMPEAMHRAPGSVAMANLQEGEEVKPFESTAPKAEFDKFVDHFTSHLSASRSMPVEVLRRPGLILAYRPDLAL
jgi:capsid protein